jgi:hypothetical protein
MANPLMRINVQASEHPRVVYFVRCAPRQGAPPFEEVSNRVASLTVQAVTPGSDGEAEHYLCRWDRDNGLVWRTKHPSRQEAIWHAEWEYGVTEAEWEQKEKGERRKEEGERKTDRRGKDDDTSGASSRGCGA